MVDNNTVTLSYLPLPEQVTGLFDVCTPFPVDLFTHVGQQS